MNRVCVLTDSTAQFPDHSFPGQETVNVLPFEVRLQTETGTPTEKLRAGDLPVSLFSKRTVELTIPSVADFQSEFARLGTSYTDILTVLSSGRLTASVQNARQAAQGLPRGVRVEVVDTQTAGVGLGYVVQAAAAAALTGRPVDEIRKDLLGMVAHVYSIFCVRGLSYLQMHSLINYSQAFVGEMLGVVPIYVLNLDRAQPLYKVRNARQLVEYLLEFIQEFTDLKRAALFYGLPVFDQEVRLLRERIRAILPELPLSEHAITPALASLLGPQSIGLFLWEGVSG